nr:hypothetical protein [Tanacetum cinerariifolium]
MVRQVEAPLPAPAKNVKVAINPEYPDQSVMIGEAGGYDGFSQNTSRTQAGDKGKYCTIGYPTQCWSKSTMGTGWKLASLNRFLSKAAENPCRSSKCGNAASKRATLYGRRKQSEMKKQMVELPTSTAPIEDYHGERISPDHVDDLPEVESNQHEPALVDENEELEQEEEEEFEDEEEFEEEEPQEEQKDMEVDVKEEENEPELIFPYVEADPLNPPPPASDLEFKDVVEVEDTVEPEDETVLNSVHEVGESSTATFLREDERVECKNLKKELEDARSTNTLLSMQKERVERDLYWTSIQAHQFYREMIRRGVVFEERPNEAIDVLVKDEESQSSEPIVPPKSGPMTQAAIERMITLRINVTLTADRDRRENVENNDGMAGGYGQGGTHAARECTFAGFMKCNPIVFHGTEGACHNCGKVGHKSRYYKEKNVATGVDAQPVRTFYDCDINPDKLDVSYEVELADGKMVVHIPCGNKTLIVEGDKGLPPPRQVEFIIDLVLGDAPVARVPYRLV